VTITRLRIGLITAVATILLTGILMHLLRTHHTELAGTPRPSPPTTAGPGAVTANTTSNSPTPTPSPSATANHTGSDGDVEADESTRQLILAAAQRFLLGWTETDPVLRRQLLDEAATPHLATPLLSIPVSSIPTRAPRDLQIRDASPFAATVTGLDPDVMMLLIADPTQTPVWRVDDIAPTS